jgi:integrase
VFRPIKEKRKKTIPLAPELVELLRAHYQEQLKERLAAGSEWQDFDVVFARPDGRPTDPRDDWEEWASILTEAGVKHRGTHITRHTAATLLLDEGVALAVVQEMLGHSDIRVTRGTSPRHSPKTPPSAWAKPFSGPLRAAPPPATDVRSETIGRARVVRRC